MPQCRGFSRIGPDYSSSAQTAAELVFTGLEVQCKLARLKMAENVSCDLLQQISCAHYANMFATLQQLWICIEAVALSSSNSYYINASDTATRSYHHFHPLLLHQPFSQLASRLAWPHHSHTQPQPVEPIKSLEQPIPTTATIQPIITENMRYAAMKPVKL
jgi:hypothetical protein